MKDGMRVLIAYDGSAHADDALADLRRAGLPREAEALLVSVADGLVGAYFPAAELAGPAVTDVIHLLAELVENATAFSPPRPRCCCVPSPSPPGWRSRWRTVVWA